MNGASTSGAMYMTRPVRMPAGLVAILLACSEQGQTRAGRARSVDSDAGDVEQSRNGDGEAYRRLVERHQRRISSMMWRFSRDPVTHEELVQDVFVEAYRSLPSYRARAPFEHWLARIATRIGYRHWKRMVKERENPKVPIEEWDGLNTERARDMGPSEAAELLHRLFATLPPRDRLVLTLRYLEDRSIEETARLTGWSRSMTKVQAWRARKRLKRLLEEKMKGQRR